MAGDSEKVADRYKTVLLREFRQMAGLRALRDVDIKIENEHDVEKIMRALKDQMIESERDLENLKDSRNSRGFDDIAENRLREV